MKILYCSGGLCGLDSLLFDGTETGLGLPSQTKVLKGLVEQGHDVDILDAVSLDRPLNIKADWLKTCEPIRFMLLPQSLAEEKNISNVIRKASFPRYVEKFVDSLLAESKYDFVYSQGERMYSAAKSAARKGIPCGHRAYGSSARWLIRDKGRFKAELRHPDTIKSLMQPRSFLLATNDGSHVDEIVRSLCGDHPLPYDFYQWDNGVDIPSDETLLSWGRIPSSFRYLFYGARIDYDKGQIKALEIFRRLESTETQDLKLVFAGGVYNNAYNELLHRKVAEYGLEDRVIFLGPIEQYSMQQWHHDALATFFLYDESNRGNSFLEAMAAGSVAVVPDRDASVVDLLTDGYSGLAIANYDDAARKIAGLAKSPSQQQSLREHARNNARRALSSWTERVQKEIDLIEKYANQ